MCRLPIILIRIAHSIEFQYFKLILTIKLLPYVVGYENVLGIINFHQYLLLGNFKYYFQVSAIFSKKKFTLKRMKSA